MLWKIMKALSVLEAGQSHCFDFDIDGLAEEEQELVNLVECLNKTSSAYGIEISAEKTKLLTNNTHGISTEVKVSGQRLEGVTSFKYLGSIVTGEDSKAEILVRSAHTETNVE